MTQKEYNKEKGLPLDFKDPKYDNKLSREYYLKCEEIIYKRYNDIEDKIFGVPIENLFKGLRYKHLIYEIFTHTHFVECHNCVNSIDKGERFYNLENRPASKIKINDKRYFHVISLKNIQNDCHLYDDIWYDLCRWKNKNLPSNSSLLTKKLTPNFKTVTKEELDKRRNKNIDHII